MTIYKFILGASVLFSALMLSSCGKEKASVGHAASGDFDIVKVDEFHYQLINKTPGPNIAYWQIPNLGKDYKGNVVSVYIGSAGSYDVVLFPGSNGDIDKVVKNIKVISNDPALYKKESDIVISGWYNDGWNDVSHNAYLLHNEQFSEVNPFWYNLGKGTDAEGKRVSDGSIYQRDYAFNFSEISEIRNNGDYIIPAIGDMDTEQINRIIANPTARQKLIDTLVNVAKNKNYDGWDLDFELGTTNNGGKALFSHFVKDLGTALNANGKTLDVTIGGFPTRAKENDWIFDLDGLNIKEVRYIKIMAYDRYLGMNPVPLNPVGEYDWVNLILKYVINERNVPAKKIILGIPNYGWAYRENPATNQFEIQRPFATYETLTTKAGFASSYQPWCDEEYGEWFEGPVHFAAFYNDAVAVKKRLELIKIYGLAGACFWVLGKEDPAIFPGISTVVPGKR